MPQAGPEEGAVVAVARGNVIPSISITVPDNSQNLVTVTNRKAALRRKISKKRLQKKKKRRLIVSVLASVIVVLAIALIVVTVALGKQKKEVSKQAKLCVTEDCLASAYRLVKAMKKDVDPCQDFYKFACGNWLHDHPLYGQELETSRFTEARVSLSREIQDILETENLPEDPIPVRQARELYGSCMNTDHIEKLGLEPLREVLEMVGLPRVVPSVDTLENFTLTRTLALIQFHLTVKDLMLVVGVNQDPENASRKLLLMLPPVYGKKSQLANEESIIGPGPRYYQAKREKENGEILREELRYRSMVMALFEDDSPSGKRLNSSELVKAAMKTLVLEGRLFKAIDSETDVDYKTMTMKTLQKHQDNELGNHNLTDTDNKILWDSFIEILFQNVDKLDHKADRVFVSNLAYFRNLAVVLAEERTLSILAAWIARGCARRRVKRQNLQSTATVMPRECLRQIHDLMPAAVGYKIAESTKFGHTKKRVEEMLLDIRTAFISLVKEAQWMDDKTREEALGKVYAMGHMIGFPDYLLKKGYLEELYSEVKVDVGKFLKSVVNIHSANAKNVLKVINATLQHRNVTTTLPDPFVVNAYNAINYNFIVIPSGILRVPFYGLGLEAMNYGAIGFVLAHELTHSFDNTGRQFDKSGELRNWWTSKTTKEFNDKASCFRQQYGRYQVQGKTVDGKKTLGENIADNGGLREAIRAYRNYVIRRGEELKLPGLEHLTHEQLLYLAFANVWCQSTTKRADILLLNDVHSPAKYRVIGTLSNMEEFSEAWNCPKNSEMNPGKKCVLW